jgi:hypothetical protein
MFSQSIAWAILSSRLFTYIYLVSELILSTIAPMLCPIIPILLLDLSELFLLLSLVQVNTVTNITIKSNFMEF